MENNAILLLDGNLHYLKATYRLLSTKYHVRIATRPTAALELLQHNETIAVIIADYTMPEMDGIHFFSHVLKIAPHCKRIMFTACSETSVVINAINHGKIDAFLQKPCSEQTLLNTVESVLPDATASSSSFSSGYTPFFPTDCLKQYQTLDTLTSREREILGMISMGFSNQDIAIKLGLTLGTVKSHCRNIFNKLGVSSRTQAIAVLNHWNNARNFDNESHLINPLKFKT